MHRTGRLAVSAVRRLWKCNCTADVCQQTSLLERHLITVKQFLKQFARWNELFWSKKNSSISSWGLLSAWMMVRNKCIDSCCWCRLGLKLNLCSEQGPNFCFFYLWNFHCLLRKKALDLLLGVHPGKSWSIHNHCTIELKSSGSGFHLVWTLPDMASRD